MNQITIKNFLRELRSFYHPPCRSRLSDTLLDITYQNVKSQDRQNIQKRLNIQVFF